MLSLGDRFESPNVISQFGPAKQTGVRHVVQVAKRSRFVHAVGGELLGDTTLRGIESRIRGVMGGVVSGGEFSALADIGVDLTIDGTLEVDDEKLDAAVADNLGALTDFFSGTGESEGLAAQLDATLGKMLGESGTLGNATSGLEDRIEGLGERYLRTEERIDSTIARYREQFSKLDSMIAEMNSTSSYLTQQFDSLNAQLSQ